ncbi:MAG TPA: branched-chain amino acid ABC transporter permease [Spirochaetota bacterium]|nr:branched-chain amino acid ABC transporter permease [Spirochaetota bacterium]
MTDFLMVLFIYIGIYSIASLGLNLIVGYTGLLSLCQAAFVAIGAYTTAIIMTSTGLSFWWVLPVAGITASLSGLLIGIPTLRLKGDYLAIATLGFGEIVKNLIINWDSVTKGPMGINGIPAVNLFGIKLTILDKLPWMLIIWGFVFITYYLVRRIVRSRIGRALEAIREDEIAASSMGINTAKYKIGAFITGSFFAGIAGGLYAAYTQAVAPNTFDFMMSVMILCMIVLGGLGRNIAAVAGAVIIVLAEFTPRLLGISNIIPPQLNQILFGLILVMMMIYRPQGLIGRKKINYAAIVKKEILNLEK